MTRTDFNYKIGTVIESMLPWIFPVVFIYFAFDSFREATLFYTATGDMYTCLQRYWLRCLAMGVMSLGVVLILWPNGSADTKKRLGLLGFSFMLLSILAENFIRVE